MARNAIGLMVGGLAALLSAASHAQTLDSTIARMNAAEAAGDFAASARLLERLYGLTGFDPGALGAAAVAAAQAVDRDKANEYLERAVREGYLDAKFLRYVEEDTTLASIRRSVAWRLTIANAKRRVGELDQPLRKELLDIAERDQKNRETINEIMTRYGRTSPQGDSAAKAIERADAPLLARVREIIAQRGWPGRRLVADDGAHAAWLVIQHAPPDVQRELLPTIEAQIRGGEGRLGDLALLDDRVRVADKKPQLYGSQMRFGETGGPPVLDPIVDEACVDRRRAAMGLEPLADYLRRFGVVYKSPGPCRDR